LDLGEKISKNATTLRKVSRKVRTDFFGRWGLGWGGEKVVIKYVSLQYLFKISQQAIGCIIPEVCEALVEKFKDYVQE